MSHEATEANLFLARAYSDRSVAGASIAYQDSARKAIQRIFELDPTYDFDAIIMDETPEMTSLLLEVYGVQPQNREQLNTLAFASFKVFAPQHGAGPTALISVRLSLT